jgi:hypothetical protein
MAENSRSNRWTETDFLTPEQRLNLVAEILAIIALRAAITGCCKAGFNIENYEDQDA